MCLLCPLIPLTRACVVGAVGNADPCLLAQLRAHDLATSFPLLGSHPGFDILTPFDVVVLFTVWFAVIQRFKFKDILIIAFVVMVMMEMPYVARTQRSAGSRDGWSCLFVGWNKCRTCARDACAHTRRIRLACSVGATIMNDVRGTRVQCRTSLCVVSCVLCTRCLSSRCLHN